jgi:hypothetical protein
MEIYICPGNFRISFPFIGDEVLSIKYGDFEKIHQYKNSGLFAEERKYGGYLNVCYMGSIN